MVYRNGRLQWCKSEETKFTDWEGNMKSNYCYLKYNMQGQMYFIFPSQSVKLGHVINIIITMLENS